MIGMHLGNRRPLSAGSRPAPAAHFFACLLVAGAAVIAAEAPVRPAPLDLKTEPSSRFFNWYGNKYPTNPTYPAGWYYGNGYQYQNPNYFLQQYPNGGFGFGNPNHNYPNFGNPGGYPGGYGNGYPGGYGPYNPGFAFPSGFGSGFNGFNSRYRSNQEATVRPTTARDGYVYKR